MRRFKDTGGVVIKSTDVSKTSSIAVSAVQDFGEQIYFAKIDRHKMLQYLRPEVDLHLPRSRQRYLFASVYKKIMALNGEQRRYINTQKFARLLKMGNRLFG